MRWFISVVAVLALGACKQGRGEICQVDSDCEAGLKCTNLSPTNGMPRVQHCVDADEPDPADAAVDSAPPDAPTDADLTP